VSLGHTSGELVGSGKVIITHSSEVSTSTDHRSSIGLSQRAIVNKANVIPGEETEFGLKGKTSQVESK